MEHNFGQALNYYKRAERGLCEQLLRDAGAAADYGSWDHGAKFRLRRRWLRCRWWTIPHLTDALPENDPHLIKARLLANAALNEYIRPEIQLSATSGQWGALAEAEIYQSFGEDARALQAMKRSKMPFFSLPVAESADGVLAAAVSAALLDAA